MKEKIKAIIEASLAWAEVSAGAVAKADQNNFSAKIGWTGVIAEVEMVN